ncbi:binding-protein-dependent transporters inner membrane component [Natronolimnohabitans innermongolicus JCM 12255]|uniref:Binding-protein-dependent transporters inner membrane component n=1 Tax=Natronolimnohabitans innermongolicus JCM 12255 TaxID=1227499 RepID=L9WIZ5_9EURY|nr:binding-protein-dependent transporters inner membrane component [Natronolimnohabitans innermongolicus JCM 12255]
MDRSRRFYDDGFSIGRFEITPEDFWGWLTILPVLLLYTLVALIPIAFAIAASVHRVPLLNPTWDFVGVENYANVFQLDRFWGSMWRGFVFMVGSTVIQLTVGVWMALVLNKITRGSRILSTLVFTSYLIPTIIVTMMFLFMLDPYDGVLHAAGARFGLWEGYLLGNTQLSMTAVVIISSWKFSAFVTLFTLAQLQSIPDRFYEAAKVCGATTWEMFRDITLPRIYGALLVVIFLRGVFMFNKYDIIWQLTQGGPGSQTTTMPILAYRETFERGAYGMGNAIAVVMFLALLVSGLVYLKYLNPSQEVET